MSRAINLPSQSVKLTNVAIVRLTIQNKRFEIACYKNKVLDFRNGLEKDLSEVLQTSNIHIFTNVTKGQFASSTDCIAAFGPVKGKSQEDMAIHILQHGKSVQVSEIERQQLYDATLLQIATHIATTCINPHTGIPYTTSQIKHALTTTTSSSSSSTTEASHSNHQNQKNDNSKKKGKKSIKKSDSSASATFQQNEANYQHFVIQPHKPMKQQYLQAIKYLQYNHILPIARASMELIWYYPTNYDHMVRHILNELNIVPVVSTTTITDDDRTFNNTPPQNNPELPPPTDHLSQLTIHKLDETTATTTTPKIDEMNVNDTTETITSRTMIVDPSLYRILQEYTTPPIMNHESHHKHDSSSRSSNELQVVPNSRIEILRQQVFQKQSPQMSATTTTTIHPTTAMEDQDDDQNDAGIDDDDDDDSESERLPTRRNHHHQHHQLQLPLDDDDDDDDADDMNQNGNRSSAGNIVDNTDDDDDDNDDDDDQSQQEMPLRNKKKKNDKKKKKKHLQLVQSHMTETTDEGTVPTMTTTHLKSVQNQKSQRNLPPPLEHNEQDGDARMPSTAVESCGTTNTTTTTTGATALYTCNTCIGVENAFHTTAEYRAHYRSDWHRYNQKLKSCQATAISYHEFMTCDAESFFNANDF